MAEGKIINMYSLIIINDKPKPRVWIMRIMFINYNIVVLVLITLACNSIMSISANVKIACIERERKALTVFKQSLTDPSNILSSWVGQDCCSWDYVVCNNVTRHIVKLNPTPSLSASNMLIGSEVSPSLAELKHLEFLSLGRINFSASRIPSFLGNFKSLRSLHLSDTSFAGVVPPSLGNLSNLENLDFGNLYLLKIDNLNWLSQLSSLRVLELSSVNLSRVSNLPRVLSSFPFMSYLYLAGCGLSEFPLSPLSYANLTNVLELNLVSDLLIGQLPHWLTHLPNIHILDLSYNFFSGLIPSSFFTKSSTLKHLYLLSNQLNGTIPESIGQLSTLEILYIENNFLSGTLPESIGQLYSLEELILANNSLSGLVSEIHFKKLSSLTYLDMASNFLVLNVSIDWVPPFQLEILDLGSWKFENGFPLWLQTQKSIYSISFPNAKISGSHYFQDIVQLLASKVEILDLSNCSLSGSIPQNIGNVMPHLWKLRLPHNNISGRIPTSLCGMSRLGVLDLANNHLFGDLPQSCWSDPPLLVLDLSSNSMTGLIPSSVANQCSFVYLHLSNNKFSGELPVAIETCKNLLILNLANNGFSGKLPAWANGLVDLRVLNLRSNKFEGSLAHELCSLSNLQILNVAHNSFIGAIPSCFGNFSGMILGDNAKINRFLEYYSYFNSLIQVTKGRELEYTKTTLDLLVNLDLSSNNLAGNIPEELMFLSGLYTFNLSHNRLTGPIPAKISNLKSLESLDLSHNHLTGKIPQSISELNYLTFLNLSYNNLSGEIPTGKQLQTLLDSSSYEGNQDLCGIQIEKSCTEEPFQSIYHNGKENEEFEKLLFYIGFVVGMVVGFWGVCGVLFFKKTWRYKYFRFVENVYYMLINKLVVCVSLLKRKFEQSC